MELNNSLLSKWNTYNIPLRYLIRYCCSENKDCVHRRPAIKVQNKACFVSMWTKKTIFVVLPSVAFFELTNALGLKDLDCFGERAYKAFFN